MAAVVCAYFVLQSELGIEAVLWEECETNIKYYVR
jgi:hypothetical protein